jgi:hypothetical protein
MEDKEALSLDKQFRDLITDGPKTKEYFRQTSSELVLKLLGMRSCALTQSMIEFLKMDGMLGFW